MVYEWSSKPNLSQNYLPHPKKKKMKTFYEIAFIRKVSFLSLS